MDSYWHCFFALLLVHTSSGQPQTNLPDVDRRIYETIIGTAPCFRLTNATHQIGCSGSQSGQRGIIEYIDSDCNLNKILNTGPTPPYIALLEEDCFTLDNILQLQSSPRVNGVVLQLDNVSDPGQFTGDRFSPERSCPSDQFAESTCSRPWNPNATNLLFRDFGNFPIMILPSGQFQVMVQCYHDHNLMAKTGSYEEYPLCSAELTADMYAAIDTPTCKRRETLPINYLNGVSICNPLGDHNVWGTPFQLPSSLTNGIIMLSTKLDGVSFPLGNLSYGADSEVAGIAVLLAVIEQLGALQQRGDLLGTKIPIMYTFFNGESWDYIGSSRMVYDMHKEKFPYPLDPNVKRQLPLIKVENISTMIDLSQLGITETIEGNTTLFLHGASNANSLTDILMERLSQANISLSLASGRPERELPPSSLNWFRYRNAGGGDFKSFVLTGFNEEFNNRYFGSRYDTLRNLISSMSLESVSRKLASIATAVTQTVLTAAGPSCSADVDCVDSVSANSSLIEELLTCFLVKSNCSLFRSVTNSPYNSILSEAPLERYVTESADSDRFNTYTSVVFQLVALFSAYNKSLVTCNECWSSVNSSDQVTNRTAIPYNGTLCHCVESYTYMHKAQSPAFDIGDYASTEYSTWAESRWNSIRIRIYLVPYRTTEVGVLIGGLAMTLLTLLVAIQCRRRSDKVFQSPIRYDLYHVS